MTPFRFAISTSEVDATRLLSMVPVTARVAGCCGECAACSARAAGEVRGEKRVDQLGKCARAIVVEHGQGGGGQ